MSSLRSIGALPRCSRTLPTIRTNGAAHDKDQGADRLDDGRTSIAMSDQNALRGPLAIGLVAAAAILAHLGHLQP